MRRPRTRSEAILWNYWARQDFPHPSRWPKNWDTIAYMEDNGRRTYTNRYRFARVLVLAGMSPSKAWEIGNTFVEFSHGRYRLVVHHKGLDTYRAAAFEAQVSSPAWWNKQYGYWDLIGNRWYPVP